MIDQSNMPFVNYPGGGRELLGVRIKETTRARREKRVQRIFEICKGRCAYCGVDLGNSYESWLYLSVDHVIPKEAAKIWGEEKYGAWIYDMSNCVLCCRACNDFSNHYKSYCDINPPPKDESEFFDMRNEIFYAKREHVTKKHREERAWYLHNYQGWNMEIGIC